MTFHQIHQDNSRYVKVQADSWLGMAGSRRVGVEVLRIGLSAFRKEAVAFARKSANLWRLSHLLKGERTLLEIMLERQLSVFS